MADKQNPFVKTNEAQSKTIGKADTGSRAKAEVATKRAESVQSQPEGWPLGASGTPLVKAEMGASELIPTGQYANVTIGPVRIQFLIDPDRVLGDGESYFTDAQRATIAAALNEGAEIVEGDVVAVQRNLVMESMQEQLSSQS